MSERSSYRDEASERSGSSRRLDGSEPGLADSRTIFDVLDCFPLPDEPAEFLSWPPDVFAVTARLLLDTEGYRFVVSPPGGEEWPPDSDWAGTVTRVDSDWVNAVNQPDGVLPAELADTWEVIWAARDKRVGDVKRGERWDLSSAVLTLHAFADQAASPPT